MSGKSEYEWPGHVNEQARAEKRAMMDVIAEIRDLVHEGLDDLAREYDNPHDTTEGVRLSAKREAYWYVLDRLYLLSPEWGA